MATFPSPTLSHLRRNARILESLALAAFITLFFIVPDGAAPWVLFANLATFYALFIRAIAVPDRIVSWLPSHFTIEMLFFAFSYLIFYYPYQLFLFGATELGISNYVANSFADGSNKAITLTTIGMLAFAIGYRAKEGANHGPLPAETDSRFTLGDEQDTAARQYFDALAIASSGLLLALVALFVVAGWRSAGEGRYTATTTTGLGIEGVSVAILMLCMVVGALWVYATAAQIRKPVMLAIGLVLATVWTGRLLVLGDRNSFLLFALVLIGGYFTFIRRASLLLIGVIFAVWMIVYNAIEVLRTIPGWYRTESVWKLFENIQEYRNSPGDNSFNVTTIALRGTVQMVPDIKDYTYGTFKLFQFSSAVPFSGKLYLPYFDLDYTSSAEMLTDIMIGDRATWGTGTNIISDSYIDFGVLGVVVILLALGAMAKAMRNYVARDPWDAQRVVMYLLTVALFAELPRYAIEVPIRVLAWAFIFAVAVKAINRKLHSTSSAPEQTEKVISNDKRGTDRGVRRLRPDS